jgi:SAM-dependent methyltransferase
MIVRVRMNHPDGKLLLAALRDGDFAHAGEEAAVRMAWECLPRRANQSCLDAGCGRGGTAALVQSERWGQVIGLDIDSETISFAQSAYSNVRFVAAGVTCAGGLFPAQFDIIYAFNVFYAFPDQQAALSALRLAAKSEAILCLFDYLDQGGFNQTRFAGKPETLLWRPLSMKSLPMPRTIIAPFSRRLEQEPWEALSSTPIPTPAALERRACWGVRQRDSQKM